jgi:hypothetical protein
MTDENLLPDKSVKQAGLTRKAPSGSFVSSRLFWLGVSLIIFCGVPSLRLKLDTAEKQYQSLDIKQAHQFESTRLESKLAKR